MLRVRSQGTFWLLLALKTAPRRFRSLCWAPALPHFLLIGEKPVRRFNTGIVLLPCVLAPRRCVCIFTVAVFWGGWLLTASTGLEKIVEVYLTSIETLVSKPRPRRNLWKKWNMLVSRSLFFFHVGYQPFFSELGTRSYPPRHAVAVRAWGRGGNRGVDPQFPQQTWR